MTTTAEASTCHDVDKTNKFLDEIRTHLNLASDAALCRAMGVAPPVISKARHGVLPLGANYIIRFHELTGWTIADIKRRLGIETYIPIQLRQKAA